MMATNHFSEKQSFDETCICTECSVNNKSWLSIIKYISHSTLINVVHIRTVYSSIVFKADDLTYAFGNTHLIPHNPHVWVEQASQQQKLMIKMGNFDHQLLLLTMPYFKLINI